MFDSIHFGDRCTQTKAFHRSLENLTVGSEVRFNGQAHLTDGQAPVWGGGYVTVADGHITGWNAELTDGLPIYNYYGGTDPDTWLDGMTFRGGEFNPGDCPICHTIRSNT